MEGLRIHRPQSVTNTNQSSVSKAFPEMKYKQTPGVSSERPLTYMQEVILKRDREAAENAKKGNVLEQDEHIKNTDSEQKGETVKSDVSNMDVTDIVTHASDMKGEVPMSWILATLYHESKFKQFNEDGATLKSDNDYGIGQINSRSWPSGGTELKGEGIDKIDFDKVKSDQKYNIEIAIAIISRRKKQVENKHPEISGFDKFIAMYAMYNGGTDGYIKYLDRDSKRGNDIRKHIDGDNGLVDDIDGLISALEKDHTRIIKLWMELNEKRKNGDEGKEKLNQLQIVRNALLDVKKLKAHASEQTKP